jgi:bisanhydrobacterioruberin hydratase
MSPFPGTIILMLYYLSYLTGLTSGGQEAWFMKYAASIFYLNSLMLLIYHRKRDFVNILYFCGVATAGFAFELTASHTDMIYGNYSFGKSLGLSVSGVPYAIGLYWLVLTLCSGCFAAKLKINSSNLRAVIAAVLQTGMAILIFQVATKLDFWNISLSNESMIRFALVNLTFSFILQYLFIKMKVSTQNRIAVYAYLLLIVFFGGLIIFI